MRTLIVFTVFVLQICLTSILAVDILPQSELRELDIFLQDEDHKQISRIKRTDEDAQDEVVEHSGEAPPDLFSINEDISPNPLENSSDAVDSPPESANTEVSGLNTENTSNTNSLSSTGDLESSTEGSAIDVTPVNINEETANNTDTSSLPNTESNENVSTDVPATVEPKDVSEDVVTTVQWIESDVLSTTTAPIGPGVRGVISSPVVAAAPAAIDVPEITAATGINVVVNNDTNTINISAEAADSLNNNKNSSLNVSNESPGVNVTVNNATSIINSTNVSINTNATNAVNDTAKVPISAKTNNSIDSIKTATTEKPAAVESDSTPQQSSVSGSGVLTTIIVLVVIAGIAAGGYVIYKKRRSGYDPVEVEDQDKELVEIKSENGFGKPIQDHEVKIEDQLTPTQPMPTPRTFAVTPTIEKNIEDSKTNENENVRTQSNDDADSESSKKTEH